MSDIGREVEEVIDYGGDVTLAVGTEDSATVRLRVSTAILTHASEYFATLFGPRFKEGHEASQGKDVAIREDHPDAFANLCKILHLKLEMHEQPLSAGELHRLALAADQYQCVPALQLSLPAIFPETPGTDVHQLAVLATAAYRFDHPALFKRYTRAMISQSGQPLINYAFAFDENLLSIDIWRK